MAKTLNKWLDEFVENGADASDVVNWPENAGGGGTELGAQFQPNQKILEFFNKALQLDEFLNFKQTFFDTAKFKQVLVDVGVNMSDKLFDNGNNLCFQLIIPNKYMTTDSNQSFLIVWENLYAFTFVEGKGSGAGHIYLKESIDWSEAETSLAIPKSELPDNPTLGDALDYLITNDIAIKSCYIDTTPGASFVIPYKEVNGLYNIPEFTTCMAYEGYENSSQSFMASDENFKGYVLLDDLTDAIFAEEE